MPTLVEVMLKGRWPGCGFGITALVAVMHRVEERVDLEVVEKGFSAVEAHGLYALTNLAPDPVGFEQGVGAKP